MDDGALGNTWLFIGQDKDPPTERPMKSQLITIPIVILPDSVGRTSSIRDQSSTKNPLHLGRQPALTHLNSNIPDSLPQFRRLINHLPPLKKWP
jgi:hypothetical protein